MKLLSSVALLSLFVTNISASCTTRCQTNAAISTGCQPNDSTCLCSTQYFHDFERCIKKDVSCSQKERFRGQKSVFASCSATQGGSRKELRRRQKATNTDLATTTENNRPTTRPDSLSAVASLSSTSKLSSPSSTTAPTDTAVAANTTAPSPPPRKPLLSMTMLGGVIGGAVAFVVISLAVGYWIILRRSNKRLAEKVAKSHEEARVFMEGARREPTPFQSPLAQTRAYSTQPPLTFPLGEYDSRAYDEPSIANLQLLHEEQGNVHRESRYSAASSVTASTYPQSQRPLISVPSERTTLVSSRKQHAPPALMTGTLEQSVQGSIHSRVLSPASSTIGRKPVPGKYEFVPSSVLAPVAQPYSMPTQPYSMPSQPYSIPAPVTQPYSMLAQPYSMPAHPYSMPAQPYSVPAPVTRPYSPSTERDDFTFGLDAYARPRSPDEYDTLSLNVNEPDTPTSERYKWLSRENTIRENNNNNNNNNVSRSGSVPRYPRHGR